MIRAAALAVVLVVLAALLAAGQGSAEPVQGGTLFATVGPDDTISLRDAQGNRVTRLDPGTYEIEVRDLAEVHNFHLTGPGVNQSTDVEFTGTARWTVTFREGTYQYQCDPHPSLMRGSFVVGNPAPAPSPPAGGKVVTAKSRLILTSGPAAVITLRTSAGKAVRTMKLGTYTVVVRDRSRIHNAHLRAPGYNRKTKPLTYTGRQTWKVKLARPGTLSFFCDPHRATGMRGSARIVR